MERGQRRMRPSRASRQSLIFFSHLKSCMEWTCPETDCEDSVTFGTMITGLKQGGGPDGESSSMPSSFGSSTSCQADVFSINSRASEATTASWRSSCSPDSLCPSWSVGVAVVTFTSNIRSGFGVTLLCIACSLRPLMQSKPAKRTFLHLPCLRWYKIETLLAVASPLSNCNRLTTNECNKSPAAPRTPEPGLVTLAPRGALRRSPVEPSIMALGLHGSLPGACSLSKRPSCRKHPVQRKS